MNLSTINTAVSVASSVWGKINDAREEKAREAYAALEKAAKVAADKAEAADLFPESRQQAGAVTQAAHARLERALADFNAAREDVTAAVTKEVATKKKDLRKAANKKAQKKAKELEKARKPKRSNFWPVAGVLALISAVAGGAYYYLNSKKEAPSQEPPRVEEFGADKVQGSTLVYTSTTEEPVSERDEELLNSLEEQLANLETENSGENKND